MKKNIYLGFLGVVTVTLLLFVILLFTERGNDVRSGGDHAPAPELVFDHTSFDFGQIKQSGGLVTHEFPFVYNGQVERSVIAVPGSCACTSAEIGIEKLTPGVSGTITVTFDPNLHEEPEGRFYKSVSLITDPPIEPTPEMKIWASIDLDLGPAAYKLSSQDNEHKGQEFGAIHVPDFKQRIEKKDFFLLDVHIPEQEHIPGTDAFIPFDELANRLEELPEDKDDEIIVYCRSGGMSQVAAQTLIDAGYNNVSYLEGGASEYNN